MPVAITARGNDDNVLAQVLADAPIVSDYNGNTQKAIEQAASVAAVALTYRGSDLNMLELLAAGVVVGPLTFCQVDGRYRLNATEAEVLATGMAGKLSMDAFEQTGSYEVVGALVLAATHGAAHTGFPDAVEKIDLLTGKKAIQAQLTVPVLNVTGAGIQKVSSAVSILNPAGAIVASIQVNARDDGSSNVYVIRTGGVVVYTGAVAGPSVRVTLEVDADGGTFAARIDGGLVVLSNDAFTPSLSSVALTVNELDAVDASNAGLLASAQLVTRAADMVGEVSAGFTDVCGNAIGA